MIEYFVSILFDDVIMYWSAVPVENVNGFFTMASFRLKWTSSSCEVWNVGVCEADISLLAHYLHGIREVKQMWKVSKRFIRKEIEQWQGGMRWPVDRISNAFFNISFSRYFTDIWESLDGFAAENFTHRYSSNDPGCSRIMSTNNKVSRFNAKDFVNIKEQLVLRDSARIDSFLFIHLCLCRYFVHKTTCSLNHMNWWHARTPHSAWPIYTETSKRIKIYMYCTQKTFCITGTVHSR